MDDCTFRRIIPSPLGVDIKQTLAVALFRDVKNSQGYRYRPGDWGYFIPCLLLASGAGSKSPPARFGLSRTDQATITDWVGMRENEPQEYRIT